MTRGAFARKVLEALDAPVKTHNRRALQAQIQAKGGNAAFNPFNTTLKMPGSRDLPGNTAHVQEYVSAEQGIAATVKTLREPGHGYEAIVRALRKNLPARDTIEFIIDSAWGTGEGHGADLLRTVLGELQRKETYLGVLEAKTISST